MYCPTCQADYPADWKACPKDATALLTSGQIGKYVIEGVVGKGGMGAVYRARNPDTGAAVAVKVMNREVAAAPEMRERFKREAGVVARLDTHHVCKVHDFGSDAEGQLFLIMELMKGHTLREEITPAPDYMDLARVQMILNGALKGLAAAHAEKIVHRDLKPDNIFVADTFDGEVPKLLDFGIARVAAAADANLTRTGTMMGTASYMAPEQVTGVTSQMGPWTDIYAMGAILYEMLAGAPAYGGSTLSEVLHHVLHGDVVALATLRAGLPDAVYALVDRCLSVDTAKRPQDADAMRRDLLAAGLVGAATVVPPPSKTAVDPPKSALAATLGVDEVAPPPVVASKPSPPVVASLPKPPVVIAPAPAPAEPKKRSMVPFVALGVVVIGGAGIAVFFATRTSPAVAPPQLARDAPPPQDAAPPAPPDAAPPPDAPPPDPAIARHAAWVKSTRGYDHTMAMYVLGVHLVETAGTTNVAFRIMDEEGTLQCAVRFGADGNPAELTGCTGLFYDADNLRNRGTWCPTAKPFSSQARPLTCLPRKVDKQTIIECTFSMRLPACDNSDGWTVEDHGFGIWRAQIAEDLPATPPAMRPADGQSPARPPGPTPTPRAPTTPAPGDDTCLGANCKGTKPKEVKVSMAEPSGDFGGLTADEIDRVVRARAGIFKACYQKELNHTPGLRGKIVVGFTIGGDGTVQSTATGGGTTLHNDEIESCVKSNVSRLRFPAKGGAANVTYPFVFSQGD